MSDDIPDELLAMLDEDQTRWYETVGTPGFARLEAEAARVVRLL